MSEHSTHPITLCLCFVLNVFCIFQISAYSHACPERFSTGTQVAQHATRYMSVYITFPMGYLLDWNLLLSSTTTYTMCVSMPDAKTEGLAYTRVLRLLYARVEECVNACTNSDYNIHVRTYARMEVVYMYVQ